MDSEYSNLQKYLVKVRRDLHRIPEYGTSTPQTTAYICSELDKTGVPYKLNTTDTGIIALIEGKGRGDAGRCVALRADIDALEGTEETGLSFASTNGCMHACGHDSHAAMLLGAARLLMERRDRFAGKVKLLFQTAEEISRGAEIMIKEGALESPKVNGIFSMHIGTVFPEIPCGSIGAVKGSLYASFDRFIIRVRGKDAHGCTPERGVDPITTAAQIVLGIQNISSREVMAAKPHIISIGKIHGGTAYNTIPDTIEIEGTTRALTQDVREFLARRIEEVSAGIAASMRAKAEFEMIWGAPPVINDPGMAQIAQGAAAKVLGADKVVKEISAPSMGGEDISYYFEKIPGCYMNLSSFNHEKHADYPHHSTHFDIDEDVMWEGSAVFAQIAEDFLNR